jgi:hypothetical protein
MDHWFREPTTAAVIAGAATVAYVYMKNGLNGEKKVPNSAYMKPAFLVALLVYFVVNYGNGHTESVSREPY